MEDCRERSRRFGASRTHTHAPSGHHRFSSSGDSRYSQTLEFSAVASERSVGRHTPGSTYHHSGNWEDNRDQFNFSSDGTTNDKPKYTSSRPKASGQSIGAPGSSFVTAASSSSLAGVTDGVLTKGFIPPKTQSDFITNLTKQNTKANRGPGTTSKLLTYSSLETASAPPPPRRDLSKPPMGSSGWVNTRAKQPVPKPRTLLTSAEKRLKLNNARKTSSPVISHYALRDRNKPKLFEYSPTATQPFMLRNPRLARLGKRKMNSEGSAAKPIALDSDSESEPEVQSDSASNSTNIVDEVLNDTRINTAKKDLEEKPPAVDLEEIALHAMAQILNCDVMIGLFLCIVDLFFQGDRMCMGNIRGKYEDWPFKEYYLFDFEHLQDVRLYSVSKEAEANDEIDIEETDRMGQLRDEASYSAFKLPLSEEADQAAMKSFYDPTGSDATKGYMVLRPLEDASGANLDEIMDILRCHADIQPIDDKEQAKEFLQALVKDPFSYKSSQRSRRRRITGDADSLSESDDEDIDGSITVLTYPLPPCTVDVVTIVRQDVSRLKPRRYLNDNIIDYYFKRMMLETFQNNELVQEKVLFLSSHFYSRLRAGKGSTAGARMEAGYKNVSTWLARSNFFNRSIIFIPINKDVHWSLAVILNPGLAGTDPNDEGAFSCIAVLDPLGSYHRKAAIIRNLRAFLRMQWENTQGCSSEADADSVSEYSVDRVLTLNVKTPLQENSYDCGVYVLKFAEVILKNCLDLGLLAQNGRVINKDVTDDQLEALITSSAFSAEDITATRKQVQQYIEVDASEYQVRKKEKAPKA